MDSFYVHQTRALEDCVSLMRNLMIAVTIMNESCHELELSTSALNNPAWMTKLQTAENVVKETELIIDEERGTKEREIIEVKTECFQAEEDHNSSLTIPVLSSCIEHRFL